jgi:predicted outer membrane repeat protein
MKKFLVVLCILIVASTAVYLWNPSDQVTTVPTTIEWHTGIEKPVIVFVHGLNGDAYSTWGKTEENSFMELLARDHAFADFGIASIRYPTGLFGSSPSISRLGDSFAKCLDKYFKDNTQVVIVAHSLGGIIARIGLVRSDWAKREHQIVTMVTLASPFEGSSLPNHLKVLSFLGLANRQFANLGVDSDVLQMCDSGWKKLINDNGSRLRQFAAVEGRPIEGIVPVVSKLSATKNIPPDCVFVSSADDHLSIAKPKSLRDGVGKQVREWLLAALNRWHYERGERTFYHNLEIPPDGVLSIEPGTVMRFKNGAKLISRGRIEARGGQNEKDMISFDFDESDDSESGIVLRGTGVDGSEFINCRFIHGNGTRVQKPNPAAQSPSFVERGVESEIKLTPQGASYGGAILLIGAVNVKFTGCTFANNSAYMGGAMALLSSRRIQINSSIFRSNQSGQGGGAIFAQTSDLYIEGRCEFVENTTGNTAGSYAIDPARQKTACGGALYLGFATHCDVRNSVFKKNKASNAGGAIFIQDSHPVAWQLTAVNQIHNVTFTQNISDQGDGGAVRCDGESRGHLVDVTFEDNYSKPSSSPPGAALWDASKFKFQLTRVSWLRDGRPYDEQYQQTLAPAGRQVIGEWTDNAKCFKRTDQRVIDTIVIHSISARSWIDAAFEGQLANQISTLESAVRVPLRTADESKFNWRLCKEILELYGQSCHYMIDRAGQIHQFVRDQDIAYHAAASIMPPGDDRVQVNDFSLGVQLIGEEQVSEEAASAPSPPFTQEQYDALTDLLLELSWKYNVPVKNIVENSDIASVHAVEAKLRLESDIKCDPGPGFDWPFVRAQLDEGARIAPARTALVQFPHKLDQAITGSEL